VVDQLARRLPVATSAAAAMEELEGLADRFLAERAVGDRVVCGKNALKRLGSPTARAEQWSRSTSTSCS
jgi:hypothetical protein